MLPARLPRGSIPPVAQPASDLPETHSRNRVFEWMSARALFWFGLWIAVFPASMEVSRFNSVLLLLDVPNLTAACIMIGSLRLISLWMNGHMDVWGPRLRALLSFATALIWLQFALALLTPVDPSPGVAVYAALFYSEFRTVLRAARDLNGIANPPAA